MPHAFVTGSAGFIGYHLCARLLRDGWSVTGYDGMTDYYDVGLKRARLARLAAMPGFAGHEAMLEDAPTLAAALAAAQADVVIHLAAQAGVRYSIEAPRAYLDGNVIGTFNLLEAALATRPRHVLMASTSSVYGANTSVPYRETDKADTPLSFYAATKKAGEAMTHAIANIHGLPVTLFRFFTVYGPWGRPDMALFKFTRAILEGRPIDVYNAGEMWRDFTYVDDLVEAVTRLVDTPPPPPGPARPPLQEGDTLSPAAPWRVVNIGASRSVKLTDFIAAVERATGRQAVCNMMPLQAGDVPATWADAGLLERLTGYVPHTDLDTGVARFVAWYRDHHGI